MFLMKSAIFHHFQHFFDIFQVFDEIWHFSAFFKDFVTFVTFGAGLRGSPQVPALSPQLSPQVPAGPRRPAVAF